MAARPGGPSCKQVVWNSRLWDLEGGYGPYALPGGRFGRRLLEGDVVERARGTRDVLRICDHVEVRADDQAAGRYNRCGCQIIFQISGGMSYWNARVTHAVQQAIRQVDHEYREQEARQKLIQPWRPCPGGCPD